MGLVKAATIFFNMRIGFEEKIGMKILEA